MSIHDPDRDDGTPEDGANRYAQLTISTDEFVIYDRENHRAWLQSDVSVPLADRR